MTENVKNFAIFFRTKQGVHKASSRPQWERDSSVTGIRSTTVINLMEHVPRTFQSGGKSLANWASDSGAPH